MYRVAAVGEYLADHLVSSVNTREVVLTLLVHDLGNLLKFDLSRGLELFEPGDHDLNFWLTRQREIAIKYGANVHVATQAMAQEMQMGPRVLQLLNAMGSHFSEDSVGNSDWEQKICVYSDMRVKPNGFCTLTQRFDDILVRYVERPLIHVEGSRSLEQKRQQTLENQKWCLELEAQLAARLSVPLDPLPAPQLEARTEALRSFEIG